MTAAQWINHSLFHQREPHHIGITASDHIRKMSCQSESTVSKPFFNKFLNPAPARIWLI
jgi:hypothetical protein